MTYYPLEICGLKRELPLIYISKKTMLASFSLMGDVELVDKIVDALIIKLKKYQFDYLVGPEVKVVPLICEIARRLKHKNFVICRKSVKPYMTSPIILKPLDHFPKHVRELVVNGPDVDLLKGKKVAIIDDVVSTGVTIRMMKKLMEKVGAEVAVTAAVIKQGQQFDEIPNFVYLAELPILTEEEKKT